MKNTALRCYFGATISVIYLTPYFYNAEVAVKHYNWKINAFFLFFLREGEPYLSTLSSKTHILQQTTIKKALGLKLARHRSHLQTHYVIMNGELHNSPTEH